MHRANSCENLDWSQERVGVLQNGKVWGEDKVCIRVSVIANTVKLHLPPIFFFSPNSRKDGQLCKMLLPCLTGTFFGRLS